MGTYVADFETTTTEENCHVWAWAACEVGDPDNVWVNPDIYEFMDWCETRPENPKVYFHNLKFDGQFIISWLFQNEYTHVKESRDRATRTFKTMISDDGQYYAIEVVFYRKGKNIKKVTFYDSMKLLPMSVADIAKSFHLPIKKGKIDYAAHNDLPYGSPITKEEQEYIINDVRIVAHALAYLQSQGLDKITIGKCALDEYTKIIGERAFKRLFPVLQHHDDLKQSYNGGFSWLNPKFKGKTVGNGVVLDKNSMFSWVMDTKLLPHGTPIFYKGQYKPDPLYPLYTQMIRCQFDIKPGKIPTIQAKRLPFGHGNEYITSSNDEEATLCLNSVDLELFLDHYEVYNLEYVSGWKFMGTTGLFSEYVKKWSDAKIRAKEEKNWGLYLVAKLFLNSLYGKFGTSNRRRSKIPYMDNDGVVRYKDTDPEPHDGVYVPMASFITSYAREETIRTAQRIMDDHKAGRSKIQYVYSDTDSLHILSDDFSIPEWLDVDQYRLGAWKIESKFDQGKFLRSKCYMEHEIISMKEYAEGMEGDHPYLYEKDNGEYYHTKITVAGMPQECYREVTFRNFKIGASYNGKKSPKIVPGGVVLAGIDFTIKP